MYEQNRNSGSENGQFNSNIHRGESPFKPEYDEYVTSYPGRGLLKIQISAANEAFPIKDVEVNVAMVYHGVRYSLYNDSTNSSGIVDNMVLPARAMDLILEPETSDADEAHYLVSLYHPSFHAIIDKVVTIYDRIETILPITMAPSIQRTEGN